MILADQRNGGHRSLQILLVEDSETVRILTAEYLRSRGCDVLDVNSAEHALDVLASGAFDVVFTDVSLPGMSGVDLAREVSQVYPHIALIMSSGFDRLPELSELSSTVQFLAKPYDLVALDRALSLLSKS